MAAKYRETMKVMRWVAGSLHMTEALSLQVRMVYRARVLDKQWSPKPPWAGGF